MFFLVFFPLGAFYSWSPLSNVVTHKSCACIIKWSMRSPCNYFSIFQILLNPFRAIVGVNEYLCRRPNSVLFFLYQIDSGATWAINRIVSVGWLANAFSMSFQHRPKSGNVDAWMWNEHDTKPLLETACNWLESLASVSDWDPITETSAFWVRVLMAFRWDFPCTSQTAHMHNCFPAAITVNYIRWMYAIWMAHKRLRRLLLIHSQFTLFAV